MQYDFECKEIQDLGYMEICNVADFKCTYNLRYKEI